VRRSVLRTGWEQRFEHNFRREEVMSQRKNALRIGTLKTVFLAVPIVAAILPVGATAQTETPLYNYPAIYESK
jgi:uncharacterized protein involved in cysteine biosynthesis